MRSIGSKAFSAMEGSTIISGCSVCKQARSFSSVFRRMYSHSLQWQPIVSVASGGTGINSLSGHAFCISCNIPLSVTTINRFCGLEIAKSSNAFVEPILSACVKITALHSGCANTGASGFSLFKASSASNEKRLCT